MGGCRCIFRDCEVSSSRYPGLACFHFPVKDSARFMKWVQMSGATSLLNLPAKQQKSRVVCARHFRDECFMNFRKERLLKTAVPTLLRLSETVALDYEHLGQDGNPMTIMLTKPKLPHLIPPPGFQCPLQMHRMVLVPSRAADSTTPEVPAKKMKLETEQPPASRKAKETLTFTIESDDDEGFNISVTDRSNAAHLTVSSPLYESQTNFSSGADELKESAPRSPVSPPSPDFEDIILDDVEEAVISIANVETRPLTTEALLIPNHLALEQEISELKTEIMRLQGSDQTLRAELASQTEKYAALQERYEIAAKAVKPPSKARIFTSMKKYVSASMVPLLRMDMFGSADRPWKVDERRTAVELLQLGENIYKYFSSEWRVRLPAIQEARKWMENGVTEPEEEDL